MQHGRLCARGVKYKEGDSAQAGRTGLQPWILATVICPPCEACSETDVSALWDRCGLPGEPLPSCGVECMLNPSTTACQVAVQWVWYTNPTQTKAMFRSTVTGRKAVWSA